MRQQTELTIFAGILVYGPLRDEYAPAVHSLLSGDLPREWEWVESSSNSIAARRTQPPAYYKEFLNRSPLEGLKSLIRGSRCTRARVQAEILRQSGFCSPKIHCWGRRRQRHFMVAEGIDAPGLGKFIHEHWRQPPSRDELFTKRMIIEKLGEEIGRLHKAGICHGDLRLNNILVQVRGKEIIFHFVDNERNRSYRQVPKRFIEKNLVQLNMVFPLYVTLQDRLRFFKAYSRVYARFSRTERRDLAERVQSLTVRRLVRRGKRWGG